MKLEKLLSNIICNNLIQGIFFCSDLDIHAVLIATPDSSLFNRFILYALNKCRRIRDELANQNAETNNLTNKLDRVSVVISSENNICFLAFYIMAWKRGSIWNMWLCLQEIHALRAHLEAAKYDVIKYCIGTLVSICAVGIATVRILL